MRIAFFTDSFYPQVNGVSNTLFCLSKYLENNNIEYLFFAPDYDSEESADAELHIVRFKGIRPRIYPECRLSFPPLAKILKVLGDFNPDVVHIVTELGIGLSGLRAAREMNLPIVMSYHTNFDSYLNFYNLKYLTNGLWTYMKWFHSFAQINLCPSKNTAEVLERHDFENVHIWSRGIDLERFDPENASDLIRCELGGRYKTIFLYVGRIASEKGLDTLSQSIQIVNAAHENDILFVFTGDGPYLETLAAENIPNAVFTGSRHGVELAEIYASCDVFLFPSGTETFGNVALEAMASGLPVICTDSGGVTDFTVHDENAYVCRYRSAESLAEGITAMLNPERRNKIRLGALDTARNRSWDSIFDDLMPHYNAVVRKSV